MRLRTELLPLLQPTSGVVTAFCLHIEMGRPLFFLFDGPPKTGLLAATWPRRLQSNPMLRCAALFSRARSALLFGCTLPRATLLPTCCQSLKRFLNKLAMLNPSPQDWEGGSNVKCVFFYEITVRSFLLLSIERNVLLSMF